MGSTHAASGAVVGLGGMLLLRPDASGAELAAATVLTGGAALLPDLDHPSGTISTAWGPFTQIPAAVVGGALGGHRAGTHTGLSVPVAAGLAYLVGMAGGWWAAVLVGLLFGIGVKALTEDRWARSWPLLMVVSLAAGWSLAPSVAPLELAVIVAAGWATHLAGDVITTAGIPLLWPARGRVKFTQLDAGDTWEVVTGWVLFAGLAVLTAVSWT